MARSSTTKTTSDAPVAPGTTTGYDQATPPVDKNVQYTTARGGMKAVLETLIEGGSYPGDAASIAASVAMEEAYNQQVGYNLRNLAELRCGSDESAQKKFIQEVLLDESLGGFKSIQIRVGKIVSVNPLLVTLIQVQDAGRRIRTVFATEFGSDEMQAIRNKRKTAYEASQAQG